MTNSVVSFSSPAPSTSAALVEWNSKDEGGVSVPSASPPSVLAEVFVVGGIKNDGVPDDAGVAAEPNLNTPLPNVEAPPKAEAVVEVPPAAFAATPKGVVNDDPNKLPPPLLANALVAPPPNALVPLPPPLPKAPLALPNAVPLELLTLPASPAAAAAESISSFLGVPNTNPTAPPPKPAAGLGAAEPEPKPKDEPPGDLGAEGVDEGIPSPIPKAGVLEAGAEVGAVAFEGKREEEEPKAALEEGAGAEIVLGVPTVANSEPDDDVPSSAFALTLSNDKLLPPNALPPVPLEPAPLVTAAANGLLTCG